MQTGHPEGQLVGPHVNSGPVLRGVRLSAFPPSLSILGTAAPSCQRSFHAVPPRGVESPLPESRGIARASPGHHGGHTSPAPPEPMPVPEPDKGLWPVARDVTVVFRAHQGHVLA